MFRISWTEHMSNDEVLLRTGVERELLSIVKPRKTSYQGHMLKGDRYSIPKLTIQGKIDGRRGRGRKQHSWLRNIRNWCGVRNAKSIFCQAKNNTLVIQ